MEANPKDIMLAPSDEEDHDYESATKSDAVIMLFTLEYCGGIRLGS
jgi:hypothetical protein